MDEIKTCPMCGAKNAADAEFCAKCGTPLSVFTDQQRIEMGEDPAASAAANAAAQDEFDRVPETPKIADYGNEQPQQAAAAGAAYAGAQAQNAGGDSMGYKKKKSKAPVIIAIIAAIVLIGGGIGVFAFLMNQDSDKVELDLVSNISVDDIALSGYDGEATANIDDNVLRQTIEYDGDDEAVFAFIQSVTYTVNPNDSIKSGDKITVKAEYDRTDAKDAGVKVTKDNITFTAGELEQKPEPEPEEPEEDPDEEDDDDEDFVEYYTFRVDTSYAPEQGGKDDGFAAVRTEPSVKSGKRVAKIYNGDTVDVEKNYYKNGWYRIARGPYAGYYVYESSLVR